MTVEASVDARHGRIADDLKALLRVPSVSADPARAASCREAAEWVRDHLVGMGCVRADLVGSETHPVVVAAGPDAPGRPTVLVYGHYDVQPPEPVAAWLTPPFEPDLRDGYVYARGATDDKGQFFAIVKACQAALASGPPPANFRFLIEGGEEVGSPILLDVVRHRPELLAADLAVIADSPYYALGWPAVEVAVRGICYAEIVVRTLREDLHSGLFGGVAPNAHEALVRILHALKDARGRIRIPEPGVVDPARKWSPGSNSSAMVFPRPRPGSGLTSLDRPRYSPIDRQGESPWASRRHRRTCYPARWIS